VATAVYVLCGLTSLLCAGMLLDAFRRTKARLLFWAFVCFTGLALNNIVLFVDKVVAPDTDLSLWRSLPALAGVAALVYGLIFEADRR
jgi:Family of unknown function (DUF5985)